MIGKLRERLVIESHTSSVSAEGEPLETWSPYTTVWGRAKFLAGRELEAMQKINAEVIAEFTVRYRTDITETMRVSWRDEEWNIHAILPDEYKQFMVLPVSKVE